MAVGRGAFRQRRFVVPDTVFIQEGLIDEIFVDQYPGDTGHQRGVGARTDGDPLVFASGSRIGVTRIDDDHARIRAFARLLKVIGDPAAAHARFRRVITEHHHQLAVFDI